ncbi:MAG: hypothetical protein GTO40_15355, partial [Deltaproteobacteria bacterium]|nr:hypothetical protein [Deltaproteobacteria bacterium]
LDSIVREVRKDRASGHYAGNQYCGWVIVYSLTTSEPLAIMDDFSLSAIRVGATTGVGVNYMANPNAKQVALYGSGKQARTNLEAVSKVRKLDRVKVYSPNPNHRRLFAEEMTDVVGAEIIPVDSPEKAMDGADIVLCMGNSNTPLFDGNWLKPGMHVASISAGRDKTHRDLNEDERRELDDTTFERSSLIIISSRAQMAWDEQDHLARQSDKLFDLGELLQGKVKGRKSEQEINLFASNTGTGNQFATAGAMVYEKAKEKGLGKEIPTEWLMTDVKKWADRGFFPSP